MKKVHLIAALVPALLVGAASALSAVPPAASATPATSASAAPTPTYALPKVPTPWLEGWPTGASPKPEAAEWKGASPVPLLRGERGCVMAHVREWVRVACPGGSMVKGLRVNAGSVAEVSTDEEREAGKPASLLIVFPVRPGDRRVLEVAQPFTEGRYSDGEDARAVISVEWLPARPGPTLMID